LFEQNNESIYRQSTRSAVVGKAKVMSYNNIIEAQAKRDAKEGLRSYRGRRKTWSKAQKLRTCAGGG
jgi:hypothetical protein